MMKTLARDLSALGYGSRREVMRLFRDGRVTDAAGAPLDENDSPPRESVRVDGEPLDPPPGMVLMLHKPAGFVCSTKDPGRLINQLLPPRFPSRKVPVSPVGRLDKDTTGLLLLTDDGQLLHRIVSPRRKVPKVYEATLAHPLRGDEITAFASGTLMLRSEHEPLAPARLEPIGERRVRVTLWEGRYHQLRRMFAALGNHVESLHRAAIGGLTLGDLPSGQWRPLGPEEVALVFAADEA